MFFLAAEGMKLRASKGETNGTVKPTDTNPVSISLVFPLKLWFCCSTVILYTRWQHFPVYIHFFLSSSLSRMKIWSGWRITFPAPWPMCKHRIEFTVVFPDVSGVILSVPLCRALPVLLDSDEVRMTGHNKCPPCIQIFPDLWMFLVWRSGGDIILL